MSSVAKNDIAQILTGLQPRSILNIYNKATDLFTEYAKTNSECKITSVQRNEYSSELTRKAGLHDLVILAEPLSCHSKTEAGNVLSRLRDIYSRHLLLLTSIGDAHDEWQHKELLAYGLNELNHYNDGTYLFEYNILNYKQTPDWLNSNDWANPKLWNKHRW